MLARSFAKAANDSGDTSAAAGALRNQLEELRRALEVERERTAAAEALASDERAKILGKNKEIDALKRELARKVRTRTI